MSFLLIASSSNVLEDTRCFRLSKTDRYCLSRFCFEMTRHVTKTRCQLSWRRGRWTPYMSDFEAIFLTSTKGMQFAHRAAFTIAGEDCHFQLYYILALASLVFVYSLHLASWQFVWSGWPVHLLGEDVSSREDASTSWPYISGSQRTWPALCSLWALSCWSKFINCTTLWWQ
jgi:hypothetical protein